jgi:precorrin-4 methylase
MNIELENTIAKLESGNSSLYAALREEHERAKKLEVKNATLHVALSDLLNTSAVVKSGDDFTEISCCNAAYNAAYAALKSDKEDGQ